MTCDPAAQRERLLARGTSGPEADQRIAAQAGMTERLRPSATRVLDTSGGAGETRRAVEAAFEAALAASAEQAPGRGRRRRRSRTAARLASAIGRDEAGERPIRR